MKIYCGFLIAIFITSCSNHKQLKNKTANLIQRDSISLTNKPIIDSIHFNYLVDSFIYTDKTKGLDVTAWYAYSKDSTQSAFKELSKQFVKNTIDSFSKDLQPPDKEDSEMVNSRNTFDMEPSGFYEDSSIITLRYYVSVYYAGAAHGISYYASINYLKKENKVFEFKDFFTLDTKQDTISLGNEVLIHLRDEFDNEEEDSVNLSTDMVRNDLDKIDFTIEKDTVLFNFGYYALGNGLNLSASYVPRNSIGNFISNKFK